MKTFITLGQEHVHEVNGKMFNRNCVAVIEAEDEGAARILAFEAFGDKFCFSYAEERFDMDNMKYFPRGITAWMGVKRMRPASGGLTDDS